MISEQAVIDTVIAPGIVAVIVPVIDNINSQKKSIELIDFSYPVSAFSPKSKFLKIAIWFHFATEKELHSPFLIEAKEGVKGLFQNGN